MNKDIRIAVNLFTHRKTVRLQRSLGDKGVTSLIKLWCYVGTNNPKGDIADLTDSDLEAITGYPNGEKLRKTLLEIGFLDERDGVTSIHNWQIHNGWAYGAEERSEAARRKALKKWNKQYADSMLDECTVYAPLPAPVPVSVPKPVQLPAPPPTPIGKVSITAPSPEPGPEPSPEPVPDSQIPF